LTEKMSCACAGTFVLTRMSATTADKDPSKFCIFGRTVKRKFPWQWTCRLQRRHLKSRHLLSFHRALKLEGVQQITAQWCYIFKEWTDRRYIHLPTNTQTKKALSEAYSGRGKQYQIFSPCW
jgi:hypothetical protein